MPTNQSLSAEVVSERAGMVTLRSKISASYVSPPANIALRRRCTLLCSTLGSLCSVSATRHALANSQAGGSGSPVRCNLIRSRPRGIGYMLPHSAPSDTETRDVRGYGESTSRFQHPRPKQETKGLLEIPQKKPPKPLVAWLEGRGILTGGGRRVVVSEIFDYLC